MTIRRCIESERRRPGAIGSPIVLSDGARWLFPSPTFIPRREGLTRPDIDQPLDRLFDGTVRGENLEIGDLYEIAGKLLRLNYDLTTNELKDLLETSIGEESQSLFDSLLSILLGSRDGKKSYIQWVRTSLLANGLGSQEIPAADILDVMAVLVATNRTIPLTKFADACRELDEQARLDTLL